MISSTLRKENVMAAPAPPISDLILACGACDQEMGSSDGLLPLHMARGKLCLGSYSQGHPPKFGQQIQPPLTIPDVSKLSISELVSADTCMSCGGGKAPGYVFCRTCYELLPFLHKKCLPQFMRGYLFADQNRAVRGHYSKEQFMRVYKAALAALADIRNGVLVGEPESEKSR